jgi:hypothetical protein
MTELTIMVSAYCDTRTPEEKAATRSNIRNKFIAEHADLIAEMQSKGWRDISRIGEASDEILVACPAYRDGFYKAIASKSLDGIYRDSEYNELDEPLLWMDLP